MRRGRKAEPNVSSASQQEQIPTMKTHNRPIHLHRPSQSPKTPPGVLAGSRAASQTRARRVKINGVLYASITDAAAGEGCSSATIKRRIEQGEGEYK